MTSSHDLCCEEKVGINYSVNSEKFSTGMHAYIVF